MHKLNKYHLLIITLLTNYIVMSQTAAPSQDFSNHPRAYTQRKSFWFEANLNGTLKKDDSGRTKLQYQIDWQYRRAGDANFISGGQSLNIFKEMQQHVFRPWLHYWPVSGKVRLSISPIGQWGTWTPKAEGTHLYFTEYRSTYQLTLFQKIRKFEIQQRYRYEFRWIGNKNTAKESVADLFSADKFLNPGHKMRLRYLMRVNYPISKSGKSYISVWDELFVGMGKHVASNKIWDQNRVVALYGRKLNGSNPIKVELGLLWQVAPKYDMEVPATQSYSYQKNNIESNLAFQVYLIFDEFDKLFKSKKKPITTK